MQYLGERHVFRQMQYNTMLTGFAFVSRELLDLYWSDRYTQGGALQDEATVRSELPHGRCSSAAL